MADDTRALKLAELAHIYRVLIGARIRSDWQYRTSFFLFLVGQFLISFLDFVAVALIFGQIPRLAGWSLAEVAFLYGVSNTAFNVCDVFVSQVELVPARIKAGTFDQLLIRPLGTLLQLCADEFALRRLGKLLQGLLVLSWAVANVDVAWTIESVAMTVVMLASGVAIFGSIWVLGGALSFWLLDGREVINSFTYGGNFMSQYPLGVYSAWLRRLLAFVIPTAFVAYYPALYVLGRDDLLGMPSATRFLSPAIGAAMVAGAAVAWRGAVRHYQSTGS